MSKGNGDFKVAAVVTIKDAASMTTRGRREVADWLRHQADALESDGVEYRSNFRARYMYYVAPKKPKQTKRVAKKTAKKVAKRKK